MLRFWETRFSTIKPLKRGGGRRYYRPEDVLLLKGIRTCSTIRALPSRACRRSSTIRACAGVIGVGEGRPVEALPERWPLPEGEPEFDEDFTSESAVILEVDADVGEAPHAAPARPEAAELPSPSLPA